MTGAVLLNVKIGLTNSVSTLTNSAGYFSFVSLANGTYTATPLLAGYIFNPASSVATINNADASFVNFNAVAGYTIGGTVNGLIGTGLALRNNGDEVLLIGGNGSFTFKTAFANGATYSIDIGLQPSGSFCQLTNGLGSVNGNVTNIVVNCS